MILTVEFNYVKLNGPNLEPIPKELGAFAVLKNLLSKHKDLY